MQRITARRLAFTLLMLALSLAAFASDGAQPVRSASLAQTSDETALRSLIEQYLAADARKDLQAMLRLWSAKSPKMESRRKALEESFKTQEERTATKNRSVSNLSIEGEKAKARLSFEFASAGKGQAAAKSQRVLHFVREEGVWKVWQDTTAAEDLAASLAAARTDEERARLLREEKELVTVELQRALLSQGDRQRDAGEYPQALISYGLALDVAGQLDDAVSLAKSHNSFATIYFLQGNYALSLEQSEKVVALKEEAASKVEVARAFHNIGIINWQKGNYGKALEFYDKSLALYTAVEDKAGMGRVLSAIGIIHRLQGNYGQAIEFYQKGLTLSEAAGEKIQVARAYNNLGVVNNALGNSEQALEYYRKGLAIYEGLGYKAGIAGTLDNMAIVYRFQGNYRLSLEHAQKSLKMSEALGSKQNIALSMKGIASIYSAQGLNELALDYRQKTLALNEALGNKTEIAFSNYDLGTSYLRQANYELALKYYQKSLEIREVIGENDGTADSLQSIGLVYERLGKWDAALEFYRKSLAIREASGNKRGLAGSLYSLARFYDQQGNPEQALEFAERAAGFARQPGFQEQLWQALTVAGRSYRALNRTAEAHRAFNEAISIIETLRAQVAGGEREQQLSFEGRIAPYLENVRLLVGENRVAEAFTFAERARARVLLDVLHSGRVNVRKAMTPEEQEQERKLMGEIVSLNAQLTRESARPKPDQNRLDNLKAQLPKARLNLEAFQSGLYASHPQLKAKRGEAPTITPEQAGELLPDNKTALLEYLVTDERTYLFVLTKKEPQAKAELKAYSIEVKRDDLNRSAESYRRLLAERNPDFSTLSLKLYDLLLRPAQKQLEGRTNLVIVPDGSLWNLPFQALQSAEAHYVVKDHAIAYAPSLTVLVEMTRLRRSTDKTGARSPTLLAFGNPAVSSQVFERVKFTLRDEKLDPLPEAEKEVRKLADLYGAGRSRVYIGTEAREDRAKAEAGKYRIIHLATHGILNDSSPMYSYLLLSQPTGGAEDGLLEAWEIMNLNLQADLVVLSACDTARGRVGAGEGVIGLTWALFVAGAPTTVVSQWKVESTSTAELMTAFHQNLMAGLKNQKQRASEADALRRAILRLQQDERYRHPFYWAGFVVVGTGF